MKKYKLLKDLPLLKAGAIFILNDYDFLYYIDENYTISFPESDQNKMKRDGTFDEWFEEIESNRKYYAIDEYGEVLERTEVDGVTDDHKAIGNYFKTREEAFYALEKIVAFRRLREDGLKFDGFTRTSNGEIIIRAMMDGRAEEWNHSQDEDLECLYRKEDDNEHYRSNNSCR